MKYLMTALTLVTLASCSHSHRHHPRHAEMEQKMEAMSFEDAKKFHLDMISKRESSIQEMKSCVNGAKTKEDLKKCKPERGPKKGGCHGDKKSCKK